MPASRSIARDALRIAADLCEILGVMTAGATALACFAAHHWLADNLTHFRWQYAVALLVACAIGWKRRRLIWLSACACGLVWNLALLAPFHWPRPGVTDPQRPTLTVLVANLWTRNATPERAVRWLQDTPADVAVLMEINDAWTERLRPWSAKLPGRIELPQEDNFGIGLYSRLPLTGTTTDPIAEKTTPAISARLALGGREVELLAVHPLPPVREDTWRVRNAQLAAIARWASEGGGNRVVAGDLNCTPWSPFFRRMLAEGRLDHARRGFGLIPSWPARVWPLWIPLDTALVRQDLRVAGIARGPNIGSDHYPILIRLQWR